MGSVFAYAQMLRNDTRWRIWSDHSFRVGMVGLIAGIAYTLAIRDETLMLAGGLLQRCFFVPLVSWLLITALWLGMTELAGNSMPAKLESLFSGPRFEVALDRLPPTLRDASLNT